MNSSRLRRAQQVKPPGLASESGMRPSSARKRAPQSQTYTLGERCLARWNDSRKWKATVTDVLENGIHLEAYTKYKNNHRH